MANPKSYDVWLIAANTVYKGVPFTVVADWAQQGRVGSEDKVRPSGTQDDWLRAVDHPLIGDYLFRKSPTAATAIPTKITEALEPIEMDVGWKKSPVDDDDDVDMIPLIDVSLVLLIFFMLTSAVSSVSAVNVPEMKNIADLKVEGEAFTVTIDKSPTGDAVYGLRIGEKQPEKLNADLISLTELTTRLDIELNQLLSSGGTPPEVRIACHKELPSERVQELAKELQKRKDALKIAVFGAEVNERRK